MNADNDDKGNIAQFPVPNRDKIMLLCECGCETFNLIANGTMECAYCDTPVNDTSASRWIERMPVPTFDSPVEEADDFTRNSYMRTAEFARKKIAKTINHWVDTKQIAMLLGYNASGAGHLWVDITTEDQREWVLRKLESLKEYVGRIPLAEGARTVEYIPTEEEENVESKQEQPTLPSEASTEEATAPASESGTDSDRDASGG